MAADLNLLVSALRTKIQAVIVTCQQDHGITMRPSTGLRDPFEQARLWRQSRSIEEIRARIKAFEVGGAPFLAHCLDSVGPQDGRHVTNAPPGFSWHQWGEALDCFWLLDNKAEWSTTKKVNGKNGYQVYADEAEKLGLVAGGHWKSFKDWPHVQVRAEDGANDVFTLTQIDAEMKQRFG